MSLRCCFVTWGIDASSCGDCYAALHGSLRRERLQQNLAARLQVRASQPAEEHGQGTLEGQQPRPCSAPTPSFLNMCLVA